MLASQASPEAQSLIARAHAWDNHTCLPIVPNAESYGDLGRMRSIGYTQVSVNAGFDLYPNAASLDFFASLRRWLLAHPEEYQLVQTALDVRAAKAAGRLGVHFDIEGISLLEGNPDRVFLMHALGVRWMLLVYNRANAAGSGCHDETDEGLTSFGRDVVRAMNACSMAVCCSHTGERTALDIIETSERPVILSHSNPKALVDHPRNVSDTLMRAVADSGGVIGINGMSAFIGETEPTAARTAEHIDYAVNLVGPRHVGIALDACIGAFDLGGMLDLDRHIYPEGYGYDETLCTLMPESLPAIVDALIDRGYDGETLCGILGDNWLRAAEEGWTPMA